MAKAKKPSGKPSSAAKSKGKSQSGTKGSANRALILELADLLDETGLTEIEIDGGRVRVSRGAIATAGIPAQAPAPVSRAAPAPQPVADATSKSADYSKHPGLVASPMVGTAYMSPEPGKKPFVDVGQRVKAGQTLLIIEAMKTMNQIPAPRDGTVTQILFDDGQPVEFGQALMIVE
jgi:acetyl-CoA carboxylase biotin carboxyl carrier protein